MKALDCILTTCVLKRRRSHNTKLGTQTNTFPSRLRFCETYYSQFQTEQGSNSSREDLAFAKLINRKPGGIEDP